MTMLQTKHELGFEDQTCAGIALRIIQQTHFPPITNEVGEDTQGILERPVEWLIYFNTFDTCEANDDQSIPAIRTADENSADELISSIRSVLGLCCKELERKYIVYDDRGYIRLRIGNESCLGYMYEN